MADYLVGQGLREDAVINAQMCDYLTDAPMLERTLTLSVCVAGDLSRKRSRYLHELPHSKLRWHLYGEGWKGKNKREDITWHGSKPEAMEGSFGLVWAGMTPRTVIGAAGAYMMVTSPRVASLYLTAGMPLIVWKWSALAEFVRENKLGLVVESIDAIPDAIRGLSAADYAEMAVAARAWGEKLRRGDMAREALEKLG